MRTSTATLQSYALELPTVDLTVFRSLVKHYGWKAKKLKTTTVADEVSPSGDKWWNVPENVGMVNEGSEQLRQGRGMVLSSDEMRKRLGL